MYVATETDNSTEIGESIKAGIRIRYLSYERDELLGRHIEYRLPERLNEKPDKVLQKFYEEKEEVDEKGNRYWQLKDSDYRRHLDEQAIETILAKGFYAYVGSEVDKEAFEAFYGGMGADAQREDLKRGVQYDTCFEEYVYTGKEADHTFNTDILEKMSGEQRKKAVAYRSAEGKQRYPLYEADGKKYYRDRRILKTNREREKGERGYEDEKGIEIGEVEGKKYRLVKEGKNLVLYEQEKRKEGIPVIKEGNNIKVVLEPRSKRGYEFSIVLEGRALGKVISEDEYARGMADSIEKEGVSYRISRVEGLTEAVYKKIRNKTVIKGAETVTLDSLYEKAGGEWRLKEHESGDVKEAIAKIVKAEREVKRIIIETREKGTIREIGIFTAEETEAIGKEYFEAVGKDYQIKKKISKKEITQLQETLVRYERELSVFYV